MKSCQNLMPRDRKKSTSCQDFRVSWFIAVVEMVLIDYILNAILQLLMWFPTFIIQSETFPRNQVRYLFSPDLTSHYLFNNPFLFLKILMGEGVGKRPPGMVLG